MATSLALEIAALPTADRHVMLMGTDPAALARLRWNWRFWARPEQVEPADDWWTTWLVLAGRGYGKTKAGAEWIREQACGDTPLAPGRCHRIALVGETAADVRDVMVKGPSGILAVHPPAFRPVYKSSQRVLEWPNGARALLFSAEEPDQLRGPEHDVSWADEVAKWRYARDTWDMLQFGLRIGSRPRQIVTTTPRPIPLLLELLAAEGAPDGVVVTRGSTYDNSANLAPTFLAKMRDRYQGTRLGRQELMAEVLSDVQGALWTHAMLATRDPSNPLAAGMRTDEKVPDMQRVVVAVDPSGTSGEEDDTADSVGIVVAGLGTDGRAYVLEDATCDMGPSGWGRRAVERYGHWGADAIVGEKNYGGAMVEFTIRTADRYAAYRDVSASRGKAVRAGPVAALYEQGRVRHVGALPDLEDQLTGFTSTGYVGKGSPDRADALVWAITDLMLGADDYDPTVYQRLADLAG